MDSMQVAVNQQNQIDPLFDFEMPQVSRKAIGAALAEYRNQAGLTLIELEGKTHITKSTLSRTELGERDVSIDELMTLGRILGFGLRAFFMMAKNFDREQELETKKQEHPMHEFLKDMLGLQRTALVAAAGGYLEHKEQQRKGQSRGH